MRCPLLVSCASAEPLAAAAGAGADALILDLGAGEAGDRGARRGRARRPPSHGAPPLWIPRIAPLDSPLVEDDLDAVMAGGPDAVLLPGTVGGRDVQHLAAKLAVREAERGLDPGRTGIVAAAADTARGVLALASLSGASPRLLALAWDADALARDLGTGSDAAPCRLARAHLLIAAAAAGVPALDLTAAARGEGLARACAAARRDGFSGLMARHPGDVATIRAAFDAGPRSARISPRS